MRPIYEHFRDFNNPIGKDVGAKSLKNEIVEEESTDMDIDEESLGLSSQNYIFEPVEALKAKIMRSHLDICASSMKDLDEMNELPEAVGSFFNLQLRKNV